MCDYASSRPIRKCLKRSDVNPGSDKVESLFKLPQKPDELYAESERRKREREKERKTSTGTEFQEDHIR